jgi:KAP family P-loop domain
MTQSNEAPKNNSWTYFSDRPVGQHGNILWTQDDDIIWKQIEDIAQRLVEPLTEKSQSESITFAIHGDWGAGKSSFQEMIKDRAKQIEVTSKETPSRLKFCEYIASSYVSLDADVRTTLAMQVLTVLANGDCLKVLEYFKSTSFQETKGKSSSDPRSAQQNVDLQNLATYLSRLVHFPNLLSDALEGRGIIRPFGEGVPGVLIIIIDDLDRCPLETITEVLSITQQWGKVNNLFFILAVKQDILLEAIKNKEQKNASFDPDYALEKYIQHAVTLPSLDANRLEKYVESLLKSYYEDDEVSKIILDNVIYLEKGLRYKTPRAVKRCLNTIRPHIQSQINYGNSSRSDDYKRKMKEHILHYSWREFYTNYFEKSFKTSENRLTSGEIWRELELACIEYVKEYNLKKYFDEEKLDLLLDRIKDRYRDPLFPKPLDRDLVKYLATPPYWGGSWDDTLTDKDNNNPTSPVINNSTKDKNEDSNHSKNSDEEGNKNTNFFTKSLLVNSKVSNVDLEFVRLYNAHRIKIGQDDPDVEAAMDYALKAAQLVEGNFDSIPSHRADEVGNLALKAESFEFIPFADAMFQLALKLKNNHPQNMQNYVSFIADEKYSLRYKDALEILADIEKNHSDFKPEVTFKLKAQIAHLTGKETPITDEVMKSLLNKIDSDPSNLDLWNSGMSIALQVKNYDLLVSITKKTLKPEFAISNSYIYLRIRALADALGSLKDPSIAKDEAMQLYHLLLLNKDTLNLSSIRLSDIQHNYAGLLYSKDYDDEAGKLWYEAYNLQPKDENINNSYSSYLIQGKRGDLAQKVQSGELLTEIFLQPKHQNMPECFSTADYIEKFFNLIKNSEPTDHIDIIATEVIENDDMDRHESVL